MTPNETIKLMLFAMNEGKTQEAYKVAENYANSLSGKGNVYYTIKSMISKKPKTMQLLSELPNTVKNLLVVRGQDGESVYLNPNLSDSIDSLLTEWKHADLLRGHNLPVRSRVLLHGPTGNGKTTVARHIAKLSGLPFVEINSDMMINSHIGNTSANIHNVFKSVQEKCVLFWDEVDSIGRIRGKGQSGAEVENDRMVNSMLINMEKLNKDIIFIGATNRLDVLDPAFLRRFDETLLLPEPSIEEKVKFRNMLVSHYNVPSECINISYSSEANNFSQIKQQVIDRARKYVLGLVNNEVTNQDLGNCLRCNNAPAVMDYNGHGHWVCDHCNNMLEKEFEEDYR